MTGFIPAIGVNACLGKTVSAPGGAASPTWPLSNITDGSTDSNVYTSLDSGTVVQVDLGDVYAIDQIKVWHYYLDGRTYYNPKLEVSDDGISWTVIYEGDSYQETSVGKTHSFAPTLVRYIRDSVTGSTSNAGKHWVEIQAYNVSQSQPVEVVPLPSYLTVVDSSGAAGFWPMSNQFDYSGNGQHNTQPGLYGRSEIAQNGVLLGGPHGQALDATHAGFTVDFTNKQSVDAWFMRGVFFQNRELTLFETPNHRLYFDTAGALTVDGSTVSPTMTVASMSDVIGDHIVWQVEGGTTVVYFNGVKVDDLTIQSDLLTAEISLSVGHRTNQQRGVAGALAIHNLPLSATEIADRQLYSLRNLYTHTVSSSSLLNGVAEPAYSVGATVKPVDFTQPVQGAVVTASGYSNGRQPVEAFDQITTGDTRWMSAIPMTTQITGVWWQMALPYELELTGIDLWVNNSHPATYKIQASTTGAFAGEETESPTITVASNSTTTPVKEPTVTLATPLIGSYFRIVPLTQTQNTGFVSLAEVVFVGHRLVQAFTGDFKTATKDEVLGTIPSLTDVFTLDGTNGFTNTSQSDVLLPSYGLFANQSGVFTSRSGVAGYSASVSADGKTLTLVEAGVSRTVSLDGFTLPVRPFSRPGDTDVLWSDSTGAVVDDEAFNVQEVAGTVEFFVVVAPAGTTPVLDTASDGLLLPPELSVGRVTDRGLSGIAPVWSNNETRDQANPFGYDARYVVGQRISPSFFGKGLHIDVIDDAGNSRNYGYITNKVTINGIPAADRRVLCYLQSGDLVAETRTDKNGQYRFDWLYADRRYMLVAQDKPEYGNAEYNAVAADFQLPTPYYP